MVGGNSYHEHEFVIDPLIDIGLPFNKLRIPAACNLSFDVVVSHFGAHERQNAKPFLIVPPL